jgi:hypothetical protein
MNTGVTRTALLGLASLAVVTIAAGCAGESRRAETEVEAAYQDELDRAEASILAAERAGAYEHGSADLNLAREKLNAARQAAEEGEVVTAERLAVEADLDAHVAMATAQNQESQAAVEELQESIRTLEEELRRSDARSPDPL